MNRNKTKKKTPNKKANPFTLKDSNCFLEVEGKLETPATEEEKEQLFLSGLKLGGRPSCREFKVDA